MKNSGCQEYQAISRRSFLRTATGAGVMLTLIPAWLPRISFAAQSGGATRDIVIALFLRGGADGLTLCAPYGDPDYYKQRPTIGIPRPDSTKPHKGIDLDGFFALPAALAPLGVAYKNKNLLFVHATGGDPTGWTRSHFDAQRWIECGKPNDLNLHTGWLGRHLATSAPIDPAAPLRALGMDYGLVQSLQGGPHALPVPDPTNYGYAGYWDEEAELASWLNAAYSRVSDPVRAAAVYTEATILLLRKMDFANYAPSGGAVYPDSDLGRALRSTAALIKANVGIEAIALDAGGWDTHTAQGPLIGQMSMNMDDLGKCLAAFHADMFGSNRTDFTLVGMSEFGRTVAENDSHGTDHGTANAMFLLGGNVAGGRVLANWPGLSVDKLQDGQDLAITIDYRDILAEVASKRLNNQNLNLLFPDYTPNFRGAVA